VTLPQWSALPDIGLYMDQVMTLMERAFGATPGMGGITKSMVNNYVKAGLIRRPVGKKYDRDQLAADHDRRTQAGAEHGGDCEGARCAVQRRR